MRASLNSRKRTGTHKTKVTIRRSTKKRNINNKIINIIRIASINKNTMEIKIIKSIKTITITKTNRRIKNTETITKVANLTCKRINMVHMISNQRILNLNSISPSIISNSSILSKTKEVEEMLLILIKQAPIRYRSLDPKTRSRNISRHLLRWCPPESCLWTLNQMSSNPFQKLNRCIKPNNYSLRSMQVLKNLSLHKKLRPLITNHKRCNLTTT